MSRMDTAIYPAVEAQRTITVRIAAPLRCPHCGRCMRAGDANILNDGIVFDCGGCFHRLIEIST